MVPQRSVKGKHRVASSAGPTQWGSAPYADNRGLRRTYKYTAMTRNEDNPRRWAFFITQFFLVPCTLYPVPY